MSNTMSGAVPAYWSKYMAKNFDAESVMVGTVNRSVEGDLANAGDTVHVQKWGDVTIDDYVVATNVTVQTVSLTDQTLVLNQQKTFQFVIDDIEKATSHLDLVKGFSKRAMIAMAQNVDDRLLTHYSDVAAGNTVGSTATPVILTKDNIYDYFVSAGLILDEDNIPAEGRVALIDPATKALIVKSPDFVKATSAGDAVVRKGQVGDFANFKVVVSNRITTVTGTKPLMFYTPDFISLAMRIPPNKFKTYDPEFQFGTGVKGLAFYGSKVFNSTAGVTLYKAT